MPTRVRGFPSNLHPQEPPKLTAPIRLVPYMGLAGKLSDMPGKARVDSLFERNY